MTSSTRTGEFKSGTRLSVTEFKAHHKIIFSFIFLQCIQTGSKDGSGATIIHPDKLCYDTQHL